MNDQEYLEQAGIEDAQPNSNPSSESPNPSEAAPAAAEKPAAPPVEMFEFQGQKYPVDSKFRFAHGPKIVEVPYSNLTNVYRQWQHQQEKWSNEYKPKIEEFEKLRPEFDKYKGFYDKYGALQTWSEQNPEQWQRLWDIYQNKDKHLLTPQAQAQALEGAQQGPDFTQHLNPLVNEITALKQQLKELSGVAERYQTYEKSQQEQKDVAQIKQEVADFQKEFSEINLEERDPDGVSLWAKIVQWAIPQGYRNFESAARVYLKDRINDAIATRARAEVLKGFKQDHKEGIVKRSPIPMNGQGVSTPIKDIKKMSYGDLAEMAKAEIGIAS